MSQYESSWSLSKDKKKKSILINGLVYYLVECSKKKTYIYITLFQLIKCRLLCTFVKTNSIQLQSITGLKARNETLFFLSLLLLYQELYCLCMCEIFSECVTCADSISLVRSVPNKYTVISLQDQGAIISEWNWV